MKLIIFLFRIYLRVLGFLRGDKYRYSQEYEDNFRYMDREEKLWWCYKATIKQIEKAEKGKSIEEYFRTQDLKFSYEEGFNVLGSLVLTAGGDLNCSEVVYPESTLHLWDDVEEFYFSADIICANLESPLDTSKPLGLVPYACLTAPKLNTSVDMLERYIGKEKGINFFSTANNHALDQGESGLIATLDNLDSKGVFHVGTSRTPEEQSDIPIIEVNGIRVAMLSYTYCLNGHEPIQGKEYMTNFIRLNKPNADLSLLCEHVRIAKEKKADIIIAMLHWSIEFESYPIENVIKMGHRILESGVDVILGGHPHVAQPMEKYIYADPYTGVKKEGFIIYSLGEMVAYNAFGKNSRLGFIVKLEISKGMANGTSKTLLTKVRIQPIYTLLRKLNKHHYDYRVLDFVKTINDIREGKNPYGFSAKEKKELYRLEGLLYNQLLPEEKDFLFKKIGVKTG